jgi:hypothetical protein
MPEQYARNSYHIRFSAWQKEGEQEWTRRLEIHDENKGVTIFNVTAALSSPVWRLVPRAIFHAMSIALHSGDAK